MTPARGRTKARFWVGDEEMAKKDDDHHIHGHHPRLSSQWQSTRAPRRRLVARLVVYIVLLSFLCYVVLRLLSPSPDEVIDRRPSTPEHAPTRHGGGKEGQDKIYTGPLKFPELAKTLRNIQATGGSYERNKNILFAASSLRSASTLLPMACQMSAQEQNFVHFALSSRHEISLKELLQINGIDESCKLIVHDARTDYPARSTDTRLKLAAVRAFYYIDNFMHPQAVIVDATSAEEDYFLQAVRDQVRATKSALIELPERPETRFSWISKLDSTALSAWNKVHFDILIQAPPTGSANLQRLLTSLRKADKSAITIPHLTVELPPVIESPLEKFLSAFQWPSKASGQLPQSQMLSLRHRIPSHKLNEEESSVRFLESFWPAKPSHNHVLVLAPHAEVSPQFFHYVKYTLLNTLYSTSAVLLDWNSNLMGISFQSPNTLLDDTTPLNIPASESGDREGNGSPFLWQGPSSDATLFLGSKWVELHGYLASILEKLHTRSDTPVFLAKKDASKKHPAWLEYALQLSRLRGYATLYPSPETASTIMGAHSDLGNTPEEYLGDDDEGEDNGKADQATSAFDPTSGVDMLTTLPHGGNLPVLGDLPLLSWDGKSAMLGDLETAALELSRNFRREVGECPEGKDAEEDDYGEPRRDKFAGDLFCRTKDAASEAAAPEEKETKGEA
ncbi:hypothetical protein ACJ41O_008005 [Fusarium nematophilum]